MELCGFESSPAVDWLREKSTNKTFKNVNSLIFKTTKHSDN